MKNLALAGVLSMLSAVGAVGIMAPTRATDNSLPVGTIIAWGGETSSIPTSWMLCNGRALNKTVYKDLFAAIGTSWGSSGDKFNLPDLRGRFLRGDDGGTGRDPDVKKRKPSNPGGSATGVGSVQEDSIQEHSHYQNRHNHNYQHYDGYAKADLGNDYLFAWATEGARTTTWAQPELFGAIKYKTSSEIKAGEESRPKNAAVNFIIKVR